MRNSKFEIRMRSANFAFRISNFAFPLAPQRPCKPRNPASFRCCRAATIQRERLSEADRQVTPSVCNRPRHCPRRYPAPAAFEPRVEAWRSKNQITNSQVTLFNSNSLWLRLRAEITVHANESSDSDHERLGCSQHSGKDVSGCLSFDYSSNQSEILRLNLLMHQHRHPIRQAIE